MKCLLIMLKLVFLLQCNLTMVEIKISKQKALDEITSSKPLSSLGHFLSTWLKPNLWEFPRDDYRVLHPISMWQAGDGGFPTPSSNSLTAGCPIGLLNSDTINVEIVSDTTSKGFSPTRLFSFLPFFRYQFPDTCTSDRLAINQRFPQPLSWARLIC